jgi:hypothetical protein
MSEAGDIITVTPVPLSSLHERASDESGERKVRFAGACPPWGVRAKCYELEVSEQFLDPSRANPENLHSELLEIMRSNPNVRFVQTF